MTRPDETPPQTAPRFDHVLYGLPREVPTVPIDERPKTGFLRTGKRKVGAGIVAALLLSGGAGGAYAMHERNLQAEAERAQQRVEDSSLEVALAATIEEARTVLEEELDAAREVYAQSRDILAADDDARVALRAAIADAEGTLRADVSPGADGVAEATEVLAAATEAVEVAMDTESRTVLTDALAEARAVLAESEGLVADDAVRTQLAGIIDRSQQLLDTPDTSPRARVDQAAELAETARLVTEAVEAYELERQPAWEEPVVTPPVQRESVPRGNAGTDTQTGDGSSERPSNPSDDGTQDSSDPATSPTETETGAEEPTPGSTDPGGGPGDDPTEAAPPTPGDPAEGADGS